MKQVKVLSEKEFKHALAICEIVQKSKRDPIMLLLSNYAGLRVGEITSLKWSEVLDRNEKPKTMFYSKAENTKAKEARQVHLNARLKRELAAYWEPLHRWMKLTDTVILSQKSGSFTGNSLVQAFRRIFHAAGIEDASSHSGRRWFITKLANA